MSVWTGTFSSSFENHFLDRIAKESIADPIKPKIVLVGSNLLGIHLRHALALRTDGHMNVQFHTFVDLAENLLWSRLTSEGRIRFPSGVEEFLIEDLAQNLSSQSPFFRISSQKGFQGALRRTFHDLQDAGATKIPKGTGKIGELGRLFEAHVNSYQSRFLTTSNLISEAATEAEHFTKTFQCSLLFCYGFYDFTEVQRRLLRALSAHIQLEFWSPKTGVSSIDGPLLQFLSRMGLTARTIPADTRHAVRNAFSSAHDYAEVEDIARHILERANNTSLHRVGILLKDPHSYLDSTCHVLERAGLPYYRQKGLSLATSRIGKSVLDFLEILTSEFDRRSLMNLLTSFPFQPELTAQTGQAPDWDLWTRQALVAHGLEATISKLSRFSKSEAQVAFSKLVAAFFSPVQEIRTTPLTWTSFAKIISKWVSSWAVVDAPTHEAIEVIEGLREFEEAQISFSLEKAVRALSARIQEARLPIQKVFDRDGIYVGSIVPSRCIRFDIVIIPGLVEKSFPGLPQPDPLLLDYERRNLNQTLGIQLNLQEQRLDEERALFRLALSQAEHEVIMTYPRRSQGDQKEKIASTFLLDSVDRSQIFRNPLYPWLKHASLPLIDSSDWLNSTISREARHNSLCTMHWLAESLPISRAIQAWVRDRLSSPFWSTYDGKLPDKVFSIRDTSALSSTDISTYVTCPYRYFLMRELHLSSLETPEDALELKALDRGTLIHEVLFEFFYKLREGNKLPLKDKDRPNAEHLLEEILAKHFIWANEHLVTGHPLLWESEKTLLKNDLLSFLEHEIRSQAGWIPIDFEVRFGLSHANEKEGPLSTDKPLRISTDAGTILLKGRMDRIDRSADKKHFRVIDYKTGSLSEAKDNRFLGGKSIQLPIYLKALSIFYPDVPLAQTEAALLSTSYGSGFRSVRFDGYVLEARMEEFAQILETVMRGIRSGLFVPRPGDGLTNCDNCDFQRICGKSVGRLFERKSEDPASKPLVALGEIE